MGTNRISREDLLDELRRVAEDGAAPTQAEFRARGAYSVRVYQNRFGGWYEAAVAAGLEPNRRPSESIDRDELLDELRRLADGDVAPTRSHVDEHGQFGGTVYWNEFGSYTAACEAAGLEPNDTSSATARWVQEQIGDVITGLDDPGPSR